MADNNKDSEISWQNANERLQPPTQDEIVKAIRDLTSVYANDDTFDRRARVGRSAVVFARQYGVLPALGISPDPSIEKNEIGFSNGNGEDPETAVTTPYGNASLALDIEIVAASESDSDKDRPAILNIALMREDPHSNIGLRLIKSGIPADVNNGVLKDQHTQYVEIYQSGQMTHQIEVDRDGYCMSAHEYQMDSQELAKRPSGASIIPTEVKETNLTDQKFGPTKEERLELKEMLGRQLDLNRLDDLVRTVDTAGNRTNTDLKQGLNEVLTQNIF